MRGGFEHGSYLRDEVWIDTNDGLPFRVSFQLGHGNIEIDGDTYMRYCLRDASGVFLEHPGDSTGNGDLRRHVCC